MDLCELEVSLVYKGRTVTQRRNPASKEKKKRKNLKSKEEDN